MQLQDQLNRTVILPAVPERIISLVPSQTELLVDLGLEEKIVGITKFCVHPGDLRKTKPLVGGTKKVRFEKIKALQPDLILCNKEENTKEIVQELEKTAPVHVSDVNDLHDAFTLMRQYGTIFNKTSLAESFIASVKKKCAVLRECISGKREKRVAYLIWKDPLMVAGRETFINCLLELNKLNNAFEDSRYPITSIEELKRKNLDLVLLSSEPFPFGEKHREIFSELTAEVVFVDGEYFSWYGSRLIEAMDYFIKLREL